MRMLSLTACFLLVGLLSGCSEAIGERKEPIALEKVPADIMKIAQDKLADAEIFAAFTEIEDGQSVYELKANTKTGKIRELEITKDGKILATE